MRLQNEISGKNEGEYAMYFVGILCPPELDEQILQYKRWLHLQFGCSNALKSPAHITLIPPFWWKKDENHLLDFYLSKFQPPLHFRIDLSGVGCFGKNVLFINVLPSDELLQLHNSIQQYFVKQSSRIIKPGTRSFHPHVTLATRDIQPGHLEKAKMYFERKTISSGFPLRSISILELTEGKWKIRYSSTTEDNI